MLAFFKINDPLRLIILLFLMIIIRLPIWIGDIPLLSDEIHWFTLGDKLAEGNSMYVDVWDNIAPLSAGVYWVIASWFGTSQAVFFGFAAFLTLIQSYLFNLMMNRSEAYKQKTFIPGLMYLLFSNISYDFMTLSPTLISLTFLLFGLRNLLRMERTDVEQSILNTGIFFGLASLAYMPSFSFLLMGIFALATFRVSSFNRLFLAFVGFTIVWGGYLVYLYYIDGLEEFANLCILAIPNLEHNFQLTWEQMLMLSVIPAFILLMGMFKTFSYNAFINSQQNIQQLMLIWVITATLSIVFSSFTISYQLILYVPALSFFSAHQLLIIRKRLMAEITLWSYSLLFLALMIGTAFDVLPKKIESPYQNAWAIEVPDLNEYGDKMLVFGLDYKYYKDHNLATPYLNYNVSRQFFKKIDNYDEIRTIYNAFEKDMPDVIVDTNGDGQKLLDYITIIQKQYEKVVLDNGLVIFSKRK
ncbi:hypothetical protein [Flammeovirga sp. EKP202]|uniref:hypothetical protein n=1 Tax=Flammeovirga sp. EKP202 TaxID=2770592 RepID=UPI00165FB903|nr:hypothetical protein [Flammeovirga sp. EKP202]MBD0402663.1 hypothetical protein [Flammeovirga sp. EKP202]